MNKKIWISLALASAMTMMTACSSDSDDNSEGAAPHEPAFITTWDTNLSDQITINDGGEGNYTIDWGDGNADANTSIEITHTYSSAGKYTVEITGDFRQFKLKAADATKIISIDNWGEMEWTSMESAFLLAENLKYNATDAPNLSGVKSMSMMFFESAIDGDLSDWDTSNVDDMELVFFKADKFNADISTWDTGKVTTMYGMFNGALSFDQNISDWNVSNVTDSRLFDKDTSSSWEESEKPTFPVVP